MDLPEGKRITVIPTGAALGADVAGADLMKPLDVAAFKAIEAAWHQHSSCGSGASGWTIPASSLSRTASENSTRRRSMRRMIPMWTPTRRSP